MAGKIRVGVPGSSIEGYKKIIVMTPSNSKKWYPLSPYSLKNKKGHIMENMWQFRKVYKKVPKTIQRYSRYDNTIIWEYHEEIHTTDGEVNNSYYEWRQKGLNNKYAIRYPVGYHHRHKCLYLLDDDNNKLQLIEARKKVYLPTYSRLVKKVKEFNELKELLNKGQNLLIIEPDGPKQESLFYYMEEYGVKKDFIKDGTIKINQENINIMLNDKKHSFGHGYCLAMCLLNKDEEWNF